MGFSLLDGKKNAAELAVLMLVEYKPIFVVNCNQSGVTGGYTLFPVATLTHHTTSVLIRTCYY